MKTPIRPVGRPWWQRRWLRITAVVIFCIGALAIILHRSFPHLLEWYVRSQLEEAAGRLNRRITFGSMKLERLHRYHFTDLFISEEEPHQQQPFFTARRLTVGFDRAHLFTGSLVLDELTADRPELHFRDFADGSSNYREIFEPLLVKLGIIAPSDRVEPDDTGLEEPPDQRGSEEDGSLEMLANLVRSGVPSIELHQGTIDFSEASVQGAPRQVFELEIQVQPTGDSYACSFALDAEVAELEVGALAHPIRHLSLQGRVDPEDEVARITLGIGEPVELSQVPGLPDVVIRLGSLSFEYPYSFILANLEVIDRHTHYTVAQVEELTVSLTDLTLDPEDFYLSLINAQGIRVFADIDRQGRTNIARLLGVPGAGPLGLLLPPERREQTVDEAEHGPDSPPPDPAAGRLDEPPAIPSANEVEEPAQARIPGILDELIREMQRRRWWEVMPQAIELSDVSIEILVHDEETPIRTLDLNIAQVLGAKRLYNFQMDVTAEARLSERGAGGVGSIAIGFVYYYLPEHWSAELTFNEVDLQRFIDVMPFPNVLGIIDGQLDGVITLTDNRPQRPLRLQTDLRLTDFAFLAPSIDSAAIDDVNLGFDVALTYDTDHQLSIQQGDLTLGDARAQVLLDIDRLDTMAAVDYLIGFSTEHDENYWDRRSTMPAPWDRIRLQVDMPRQPVMSVFRSLPFAVRRRVDDAQMEGEIGWRFDAEATYVRRPDGRLDVEVPVPAMADILDEGLTLVSLPREVDVRRLLTDFSFTFVDGIGQVRTITIGKDNPYWVPLDGIAGVMVESILNTEDQRFFTNDGFNWTQLRVVIGQFLAEQEMGRGASTITMQTAKNILLSRERQLSRKFAEMFLTYWMNKLVPKGRILELYLNVIEFGPGINGVGEAAAYYFGERASELTLGEATFLVSIVPNPRLYHYFYEQGAISDRWWEHMQLYMQRLNQRGIIDEQVYERALRRRPEFYIRTQGSSPFRPEPLPEDLVNPFPALE